jgi:hypothetical protein
MKFIKPLSRVVPVWQDPRQLDVAGVDSSSPVAPTFLAQGVCSHQAMLPVHASELSRLPENASHQVQ